MLAPLHPREEVRLRKLAECEVLDTPPEELFDHLAFIAAQICACPIAVVNFIDRERQWFKAAVGVDIRSTPRDIAFCAHTVANSAPVIVEDATRDPRFFDNPLVVGEPKVRFYAGVPVHADTLPLGTLCVIDLVPRRLTPSQLDALTALAREVEVQLELRRALRRSQRLGEQRQQLGCMVVHDMRGPLSVALSGAQYLAANDRLSPQERAIVVQIMNAARTLERMTRDLLDVSRSESGRLEPQAEPLLLSDLVERIEYSLRQSAVDHRLVVRSTIEPGAVATLDADLVRRIIENLAENAFKYAPRGSEVTVAFSLTPETLLRAVVSDQGPGIPTDAREIIFDARFRLERDASNRARTSYGLGLSFCKIAVAATGGRIWVEDNVPTGARFIAEVPTAPTRRRPNPG